MTTPSQPSSDPSRFTSSMLPEDAKSFERTLELGKMIAQDLSDDDVLGRWMAHHLSDLITRAESAVPPDQLGLRREATDLIVRLWAGRSGAPLSSSPTSTFEPIAEALARLSTDRPWGFYRIFPEGSEPDANAIQTSLLRVALVLERTIHEVVRHIIVAAAEEATDREAKWLQAADHLADDDHQLLASFARRIDFRQFMNADVSALVSDTPEPHARSIQILRKSEACLREARLVLERLSAQTAGDEPEHLPE